MKDMIKDLIYSIMVDVNYLLNENIKEFMCQMIASLRNDIQEIMKDSINAKKVNSK